MRPYDAARSTSDMRGGNTLMATILDDEDTVEAQALSTSLDPYGQLVKMLMPRALCIAIYDRRACRCGCPTAATART